MNEELLKQVLSDTDFVKSLVELEHSEDVQTALKEKGVEISLKDITTIQNILTTQDEGELSEDELEDVAGGVLTITAAIGIASIITSAIGATVAVGNGVNKWSRGRW